MTDEHTFRNVLALGFAVVFPFALYRRLKSQATGEPLDRSQEGLFMLATLRPAGFACWGGLFAYLLKPAWMAWSSMPLPDWVRLAGIGLFVASAALLVWTLRSLGPNLTDTVVTRKAHTLVTRGPYRWVRHPVLRLGGAAGARECAHRRELVRPADRRARLRASGDAHRQRRNDHLLRPLRRELPRLPRRDRPVPATTLADASELVRLARRPSARRRRRRAQRS